MFITTFVTDTTCSRQTFHDIVLNSTTEFITVTIRNWFLTVQSPIRVGELFLNCICPVVNIDLLSLVKYFVVVFVIVPILASREQVSTCQRVVQITRSRLVFDVLSVVTSTYVNVKLSPQVETNFSQQVMAHICIFRNDTV